jgi:hypothetical protein
MSFIFEEDLHYYKEMINVAGFFMCKDSGCTLRIKCIRYLSQPSPNQLYIGHRSKVHGELFFYNPNCAWFSSVEQTTRVYKIKLRTLKEVDSARHINV